MKPERIQTRILDAGFRPLETEEAQTRGLKDALAFVKHFKVLGEAVELFKAFVRATADQLAANGPTFRFEGEYLEVIIRPKAGVLEESDAAFAEALALEPAEG